MKLKYFLFTIAAIFSLYSADIKAQNGLVRDRKILTPSKEFGRLDAVLDRVAMLRLKPKFALPKYAKSSLNSLNVRILAPLLTPEQSIARQIENDKSNHTLSQIQEILKAEEPLLRTYIVEYSGFDSPELFCSQVLLHCDIVEIAEPYYLPTIAGETPNDSLLPLQNALKVMKAIEAWKVHDGNPNYVIAISDMGTIQDHEDIFGSLWVNENEIPGNRSDDDGNGYPDDYQGYNFAWADDDTPPGTTYNKIEAHGTLTAGIAGATSNNHIGIAGTGNKCLIFPLKCSSIKTGGSVISYGYQSIVYAALMGFTAINCSWTSFNYSCINQSIIDYATSRNMVVVAAAGNHFATTQVFPASYKGVLGVGLTDENDIVYSASGLGTNAAVMAPGHLTWTTTNSDREYMQVGYGTSFASPLAAGMMGIVRSRQPSLTARQAVEFTRLCTDNIEDLNPAYRGRIGGRLNMHKAVTLNPMSLVAIRPEETGIRSDSGFSRLFGAAGYNRGSVNIRVKSYLGDAKSVSYHVSAIEDSLHYIHIIDSDFTSGELRSGNEMILNAPTGIRISSQTGATPFLLRLDFVAIGSTDDTTRDFFLVPITPFSQVYTHHTFQDSIRISITDDGNIGFADYPRNTQGTGFRYGNQCTYLLEGGIIASDGQNKVVSQIRSATRQRRDSHFSPILQFNSPENPLLGIIADVLAPDSVKLGLTIRQRLIPNADPTVIQLNIKAARSASSNPLSIGHYFNWHLAGSTASSSIRLFNEAVPDSLKSRSAAVLIQSASTKNVIGCAVVTCNTAYTPICTAFDNTVANNGFTNTEKIAVLSGAVRNETKAPGDVGLAIGMKMATPPLTIEPNAIDDYALFIVAGTSQEEVEDKLYTAIASTCTTLSAEEEPEILQTGIRIVPSPASDEITVISPAMHGAVELRVQNLLGQEVLPGQQFFNEASVIHRKLNISELSAGTYFIIIRNGNEINTAKFVKQ